MSTTETDVLIVGAGPAGLSTALHLLQIDPGWAGRLRVIEKAAHPRYKLCGGGVTRLGLQALSRLGFDLPLPIPQVRVDEAVLVYRERVVHVHNSPEVVIFQRAELDAFLAQQARERGVVICENEPLYSLSIAEGGVTAETSAGVIRARVVVGADGSKGLVRREIQPARGRSRVARLLEVVTPAVQAMPAQPAPPEASLSAGRRARFDFNPVAEGLQGYFWDFPTQVDGQACYNRGVYDARIASRQPRARLPEILQRTLAAIGTDPATAELQGHPIHWFSPGNHLAAPRLLLVGDAAGVDPLFGEGIAPALEYGRVAAGAIQAAFASGDFSFRDYRRRVWFSPLGHYLMVRWCVAWWGYRLGRYPWFMRGVWDIGNFLVRHLPKGEALYE